MSLRIVAIRHGKPMNGTGYAEDALRPLSQEGKHVQKQMTQKLKSAKILPTRIFTSPLLRAEQTAQIVSEVFGLNYELEPSLGDDFDSETILKRIPSEGTIFLIGHAPTLGDFVNKLCGEHVIPEGLSKSSAVIVEFEGKLELGKGKLINYFKP